MARRRQVQRRLARLTPGEQQVLHLLVDGNSNKTMADVLGLSVRAIEVRRAKIMQKLRAESLAELIRLTLSAVPAQTPPTSDGLERPSYNSMRAATAARGCRRPPARYAAPAIRMIVGSGGRSGV